MNSKLIVCGSSCWHWITTSIFGDGRFVWMEFVSDWLQITWKDEPLDLLHCYYTKWVIDYKSHGKMNNYHWIYYTVIIQSGSLTTNPFNFRTINHRHEPNLRVQVSYYNCAQVFFSEIRIYNVIQWDVILHRQKRYDGYACFYSKLIKIPFLISGSL